MGNSTLVKRGTEILVVLIVAVSGIALISGNTRYAGATANLMSSALLCEYNNIKSMSSGNNRFKSVDISLNNDITYINSEADTGNISGITENQSYPQVTEPTVSLSIKEETFMVNAADSLTEGKEAGARQEPDLASEKDQADISGEPVYKYITDTLNVRKGPSVDTEKLATVSKGDRVQSFDVEGEYIRIKTSDKIEGYVLDAYVSESPPPVYKYISADKLNIRKGPSVETEKLGTLEKGNRVQSFDVEGEYIKIKTSGNIEGYVLAQYVVDSLPPVYKYINADKLNVRKGPSAETEKLATLTMGNRVQFIEKQGDWALVITSSGIQGYCLAKYVVSENVSISRSSANLAYNDDKAAAVIEYAKQFLGVPYVYGGSTPKGFDCSGFTQYVYAKFNIKVPRSAKEYAGVGIKVDRTNIKPGDILLFDRYNDYTLGHVGIYIGGNQFIHASSSKGKVVIGNLSRYGGNILGIRRVIK
ncbi:MAG: SH3 domain-containing protein [Clostridiaceae bacterium]|jgi:cell wall-associated NlpC family hydrolase|nr:SH3 domain-containing protein [Clostridiaceae bacterium]